MPRPRLDPKLLNKLARKSGKSQKYIREQISKRASREGISSEAAQILLAKRLRIGAAHFQRSLPAHLQEQVRQGSLGGQATPAMPSGALRNVKVATMGRSKDAVRGAIPYLLSDEELRKRCADLLRASGNFDRAVREATTVLETRVKRLGAITHRIGPSDLMGKVVNPNPDKAILKVSEDRDIQDGIFSLCKGVVLAFRNPAHHELAEKVTREEALSLCALVNILLRILGQARRNNPSV